MPLWGSFALIAIGLVAVFAELLIPAFGLIGLAGMGSVVAAVVFAYNDHGEAMGTVVLATALVTTPLALFLGLKYFPRTFIGKRLILSDSFDRDRGYASYTSATYEGLVGREGRAKTTLRPSGVAEIDGTKHSVVTAGEFIEQGAPVRVVRVEGSRVVVRRAPGDGGTEGTAADAAAGDQDQSEGRETGEGV